MKLRQLHRVPWAALPALLLALYGLSPVAAQKPNKPPQPQSLTVMLDQAIGPEHAPLLLARTLGLFDKQKLTVNLVTPENPDDPADMVATGKADLAVAYQPRLYLQVNQGLPLKRVATLIATPLTALLVLDDSPVHAIPDLAGRRVGFPAGSLEDVWLKTMLSHHGLNPDSAEAVPLEGGLLSALLEGRVDAVAGIPRNRVLYELKTAGRDGRLFHPEEHGVPLYDDRVLVANRDKLDTVAVRRFLTALEEAVQIMVNHPEETWRRLTTAYPSLNDERLHDAWRHTLPRFALRPAALDDVRYRRFANFLAETALITVALPVSNYAMEVPE